MADPSNPVQFPPKTTFDLQLFPSNHQPKVNKMNHTCTPIVSHHKIDKWNRNLVDRRNNDELARIRTWRESEDKGKTVQDSSVIFHSSNANKSIEIVVRSRFILTIHQCIYSTVHLYLWSQMASSARPIVVILSMFSKKKGLDNCFELSRFSPLRIHFPSGREFAASDGIWRDQPSTGGNGRISYLSHSESTNAWCM